MWKQIRILFAYHLRVMDNILSLTACVAKVGQGGAHAPPT